jgi:hypothetical protein
VGRERGGACASPCALTNRRGAGCGIHCMGSPRLSRICSFDAVHSRFDPAKSAGFFLCSIVQNRYALIAYSRPHRSSSRRAYRDQSACKATPARPAMEQQLSSYQHWLAPHQAHNTVTANPREGLRDWRQP